jgi:hypothetical protein
VTMTQPGTSPVSSERRKRRTLNRARLSMERSSGLGLNWLGVSA